MVSRETLVINFKVVLKKFVSLEVFHVKHFLVFATDLYECFT
jgi:hypothetical protein